MSRVQGNVNFISSYEIQNSSPLDARQWVSSLSDLTGSTTFGSKYSGMTVSVYGDIDENNGVFYFKGGDSTLFTNWVKLLDSNTQLLESNVLTLPITTGSTYGVIIQNNVPIFHSYGNNNLFFGPLSGNFSGITGSNNISYGGLSLNNLFSGNNNATFGNSSLYSNITGSTNTSIGNQSGFNVLGDGNVFIGYQSGYFETGSNKLYISNTGTTKPLIYGEFDTKLVIINNTLSATTISATTISCDSIFSTAGIDIGNADGGGYFRTLGNDHTDSYGLESNNWSIDKLGNFSGTAANANALGGTWSDDGDYLVSNSYRGINTPTWSISQSGSFTGYASSASNADNASYADNAGNASWADNANYLGAWMEDADNLSSGGTSRGISTPNWNIGSDGSASFGNGGFGIDASGNITNEIKQDYNEYNYFTDNTDNLHSHIGTSGHIVEKNFWGQADNWIAGFYPGYFYARRTDDGVNQKSCALHWDGMFSANDETSSFFSAFPSDDGVHSHGINLTIGGTSVFNVDESGNTSFSNNLVKANSYENYGKIDLWNTASGYYLYIRGDDEAITLGNDNDGDRVQLDLSRLSSHRGFSFPDQTGIFALTSDLGTYKTGTVSMNTSHYIELKLADGNTYKVLVAN